MQKLHFLVVDDASFIRDLVKRTLRNQFAQCEIDEAINGKKAQTLLSKRTYDLVLCDWEMPEMSGLEVLEWLRGHEVERELGKTPFMMVTSRGDKSHVVKAVEAGVSDYIGKPFSADQLLKKTFKLLSIHHRDLIRSILKGSAVMKAAPANTGNDSASLLSGGVATASPKVASSGDGSASLLTAGSVSSRLVDDAAPVANKTRQKVSLGKVALRSPKASWTGDLRDINLTDAVAIIDFSDSVPPMVHEQIVIDVSEKSKPDDIARINTFVTSVVLQEKALDCHRAQISVRIVDDDSVKLEILSRYVASVRF